MPKIKKPPPYFMKHLVGRFREGRISVSDFEALQDWLDSNPEVPCGEWYKRFPKFLLAGCRGQVADLPHGRYHTRQALALTIGWPAWQE
jgi:hypothetical protein